MRASFENSFYNDIKKAKHTSLLPKIKELIRLVRNNPFQIPPPYEKLVGRESTYSRRINQQHRLIYKVYPDGIAFLRCWGHYK